MADSGRRRPGGADLEVGVEGNKLRIGAVTVEFYRTIRIPDDGRTYPLPPKLGTFSLRRVADYADRVPEKWLQHGGVFLPIFQREAMWLGFDGRQWRPNALKVAVGKVCAITGTPWSEELHEEPQDYVVVPDQPWLDGINNGDGTIRQFVAMPLGQGYSVEGQVTGKETHGGLQLCVFEPVPGKFPDEQPMGYRRPGLMFADGPASEVEMAMAVGGKIKQEIYEDDHGLKTWDQSARGRVFVHLCDSEKWREVTGEAPPDSPVSAATYAKYGYPWFDLYSEGGRAVPGSDVLRGVKSVKEMDEEKGLPPQQEDAPVPVPHVIQYQKVLDGAW